MFTALLADCRRDWNANGPMLPNLEPWDAMERLSQFGNAYKVRSTSDPIFGRAA